MLTGLLDWVLWQIEYHIDAAHYLLQDIMECLATYCDGVFHLCHVLVRNLRHKHQRSGGGGGGDGSVEAVPPDPNTIPRGRLDDGHNAPPNPYKQRCCCAGGFLSACCCCYFCPPGPKDARHQGDGEDCYIIREASYVDGRLRVIGAPHTDDDDGVERITREDIAVTSASGIAVMTIVEDYSEMRKGLENKLLRISPTGDSGFHDEDERGITGRSDGTTMTAFTDKTCIISKCMMRE